MIFFNWTDLTWRFKSFLYYPQKLLAQNITLEQGKTLVDAEGDVLRGLRMSTLLFAHYSLSNLIQQ